MKNNLMLHTAIGDAYGAGFEFCPPSDDRKNDLSGYVMNLNGTLGGGFYTDDTQMSIAVTETMLAHNEPTEEHFAAAFVECFKRDERPGYAGGFYKFLQSINSGAELREKIKPTSEKNGAAMRAAPIGLYADVEKVKRIAAVQARVTHDTLNGIASAQVAALLTHYFLYVYDKTKAFTPDVNKQERRGVITFLNHHVPECNFDNLLEYAFRDKEVKVDGIDTVRAVVYVLLNADTLTDVLRQSIHIGGDVDSVAAIAMAVGGFCPWITEINQKIPQPLLEGLEDGSYGKRYLVELDYKLNELINIQ